MIYANPYDKHTQDLQYYLVGGAVRDTLLKKLDPQIKTKEKDWVVINSYSDDMIKRGFTPIGKSFPVFLHPKTKEEYALARAEKKIGKGHQQFEFKTTNITLEDDLQRRDLTINAIVIKDGEYYDPTGGLEDLKNRQLKHITKAFADDPLRVFRVARFYAQFAYLGFSIADETLELMQQITQSGELQHLSAERVWQETIRALDSKSPSLYFQALKKVDALDYWFPEIKNLYGIPQPVKWHPEIDCGIHTMMVLQQATKLSANLMVRYAALCHDLGKATTPKDILPSHYGHEERGIKLTQKLSHRLKVPKHFEYLAVLATKWHTHFHLYKNLKPETFLKVFEAIDYFRNPQKLDLLLIISQADSLGRTGFNYKSYPQLNLWKKIAKALDNLTIDDLLKQKNDQAIKEAIRKKRIETISQIIKI